MKKISAISAAFGILLAFATYAGADGVAPATACPTNYICSLAETGAHPLTGAPSDGHPTAVLGFLSFDSSSNISATVVVNANGAIHTGSGDTGTCTSGTLSTPGTITVNTDIGSLTLDFVVARSAASIDLLLTERTSISGSIPVTVAVCHASAAG